MTSQKRRSAFVTGGAPLGPASGAGAIALLLGLAMGLGGCATRAPGPGQPLPPTPVPTTPTTPPSPNPEASGGIRGKLIQEEGPDGGSIDLSKVVIYADPIDDAETGEPAETRAATIRRLEESFSPHLSVVSVRQTVHFRDDGDLYHRIFSYSDPNSFDLGLVGGGNLKSIAFENPGMVRFYCSLHGWENGVIFVAPSPYFDTARPSGEYELVELPPGRYRLSTWSESISGPSFNVTVTPGHSTSVEMPIETLPRTE